MIRYRVIRLDVSKNSYRVDEYDPRDVLGPVDLGVKLHLEEFESWRYPVFDEHNIVVLGAGLFAGSKLFGTHRLIAVFRSPESKVLHVSAMGGAAYRFIGCGAHALVIEGRAKEYTMVFIKGDEKGVQNIKLETIDSEELEKIFKGYGGLEGAYALEKWILDNYWDFIKENRARPIVVGPAALKTIMGALVSVDIDYEKKDLVLGSEDFAGRGGAGSVLVQAHNVVAIVAGGKWKPRISPLDDIGTIDKIVKNKHGKDYAQVVLEKTKKYRFDPGVGAGGTFGVNYPSYKELLPYFNYNTIYLGKDIRLKIAELLLDHFWKPFKIEVFEEKKIWRTCGEPCPIACKKVWRDKKVDYEPFNGLGPLIGVMKLDLVRELVDLVDKLGFDAISIGHVVAWLLECVYRGLLKPEEIGLSERPILDPHLLNVDLWSKNASLAKEIIIGLIEKKNEILKLIAEQGIRSTAKILSKRYEIRVRDSGIKFEDLAVYACFGDDGYMPPNYYWTLGFVVPIYVTGRYWTNYEHSFTEPEEFAKHVFVRIIKEYELDNAGVCRFHRGWIGPLLSELYALLGISIDLDKHAEEVYRKIAEYAKKAKYEPQYPDSERTKDLFVTLAREMNSATWLTKFTKDKDNGVREWWNRFYESFIKILKLG